MQPRPSPERSGRSGRSWRAGHGDGSHGATRALLVGAAAQLVGQGLMDVQGRDLRADGASESLWIVAHLALLAGVVGLALGAAGLARARPDRLAVVGCAVVMLGACAAGLTLVYDVVVAAAALGGAEPAAPRGVARSALQLLDTLDFALVVGLVLALGGWASGAAARLVPACAAMTGLAIPALPGMETLAAGCVLVGFVLLAVLSGRPEPGVLVGRLAAAATALAFVAAGVVSLPRLLLACLAVPLVVWLARRAEAGGRDAAERYGA